MKRPRFLAFQLAGTCAVVALLAASSRGEESLQPVAEWLTSIGVKNGSREYDAESLSKLYMLRLAVKKQVDDEAIKTHLSRLTSLGSLSLDATSVTDAGLEHLGHGRRGRGTGRGGSQGQSVEVVSGGSGLIGIIRSQVAQFTAVGA